MTSGASLGTESRLPARILKPAKKAIRGLPRELQERVLEAIERLELEPTHTGTETLSALPPVRRARVGDVRILYVIDPDAVRVLDVPWRGEAYRPRDLARLRELLERTVPGEE